MVGCDMKVVHDRQGQQYYALNIVDFATTFQVMAMLDGCSDEGCAEKFWLWVVWAGPPKTLVMDMGTSFLAAFFALAERYEDAPEGFQRGGLNQTPNLFRGGIET